MINVMVGPSCLHCLVIVAYHVFVFIIAIHCTRLVKSATNISNCIVQYCYQKRQRKAHVENLCTEIPEVAFNFANFRDPLIGED